jgi:hypothetical protein
MNLILEKLNDGHIIINQDKSVTKFFIIVEGINNKQTFFHFLFSYNEILLKLI